MFGEFGVDRRESKREETEQWRKREKAGAVKGKYADKERVGWIRDTVRRRVCVGGGGGLAQ